MVADIFSIREIMTLLHSSKDERVEYIEKHTHARIIPDLVMTKFDENLSREIY